MKHFLITTLSLTLMSQPASQALAQSPAQEPVRVMVLGSYHFDNPGLDLNNIETDDVLSDRRQQELEALTEALLAFGPTLIAVEGLAEPPYTDPRYNDFSPDMLSQNRNERVQIGYRLAHAAGLDTVYRIDEQPDDNEPDYFPYGPVRELAAETGRADELAAMSDFSAILGPFEAAQTTQSIPQLLAIMNEDGGYDQFYWDIISMGDGERQPGAELAAYWFMRNAKIFNKLQQVAQPGDRVVVVYGSGHNHWLRALVERSSGYEIEPVLPYLDAASQALLDTQ